MLNCKVWRSLLASVVLLSGCGLAPVGGLSSGTSREVAAKQLKDVSTPHWVQDAVFYQIFPDRFANGTSLNDPADTQNWETGKPTYYNYFGGDIAGVIQKLPYLHKLGISAIYFNPLFAADTNHKYTTTDFTKIDPGFGTLQDFDRLVAEAHANGIRIILDGVFNHTSDNHAAFKQAAATGPSSPYWNWYHFNGFPVAPGSYWTYMGFGFMPQLNVPGNPAVQRHLLDDVTAYWTKRGIDGWRLDVPLLVNSDSFWKDFRTTVKRINPEAYIVGEAWENHGDDGRPWVQGDKFDAIMNYSFYQLALDYFAKDAINTDRFDSGMMDLRGRFGPNVTNAEFNVIGSHDTARFLHESGNDPKRLKLAATFQMTYMGAPVIYYGDEIGMTGGNDPDNRRPMTWNHVNQDMLGFYQKLIAIRKAYPVLRSSQFLTLMRHNDDGQMVYERTDGKDVVLVVLNKGSKSTVTLDTTSGNLAHVSFPDGSTFKDLLGGATYQTKNGKLIVPVGAKGQAILHLDAGSRP